MFRFIKKENLPIRYQMARYHPFQANHHSLSSPATPSASISHHLDLQTQIFYSPRSRNNILQYMCEENWRAKLQQSPSLVVTEATAMHLDLVAELLVQNMRTVRS
jgi:hypothetical protein